MLALGPVKRLMTIVSEMVRLSDKLRRLWCRFRGTLVVEIEDAHLRREMYLPNRASVSGRHDRNDGR